MLDRVLVPLDGSRAADASLPALSSLLGGRFADVILLRVVAPPGATGSLGEMEADLEADAERHLEEAAARLRDAGIKARALVRSGPAARTILQVAAEEDRTMLAMSVQGWSGITRWTFGSVMRVVLASCPVPMLLFSAESTLRPASVFGSILVPIGGCDASPEILTPVTGLARQLGASVEILRVLQAPEGCACAPDPEGERIAAAAARLLQQQGIPVASVCREGDPATEILRDCKERRHAMIAMVTAGPLEALRPAFKSVMEKVVSAAPVPVLVLRASTRVPCPAQ